MISMKRGTAPLHQLLVFGMNEFVAGMQVATLVPVY